ncbi:MAG: SH3 domain-containing protein [Pseudomonadota bacterium]
MSNLYRFAGLFVAKALCISLFALGGTVATTQRAEACNGVVRGLSTVYRPSRNSGFLAVRTGPGTGFRKIDEIFNGQRVWVNNRSGRWAFISYNGRSGWAFGRWIRIRC